jgi:hypothetical protein
LRIEIVPQKGDIMKTKILSLIALASGFSVPLATAQSTTPVLINNITSIWVSDDTVSPNITLTGGGKNYSNAFPPTVSIVGGGGTGATAVAVIDDTTGVVTAIVLTNAGVDYTGDPQVTITGGFGGGPPTVASSGAAATAHLNYSASGVFNAPFQNEVFGPAGNTIAIWSLALGTHPASGFVYKLTVNGLAIGETTPAAAPGTPAGGPWTPPLPGVYSIVSTTSDDNGNTAVSPTIRYFATGTAIVSPEASGTPPPNGGQGTIGPGTLVPVGSTIVVQATATPSDGFVQRIDFYTDYNDTTKVGTLIGSAKNYPYSVIYTPAGPAGAVHLVKALAYDNNGVLVPASALMDQITLTMTTANPSNGPTCVIVTPGNGALIEIPDYVASSSAGIPVIVTAGAAPGAIISKVELYINGVLLATDHVYPYTFNWQPSVTGVFSLTALAYDNLGNVVASTTSTAPTATPAPTTVTVEAAPAVAITSPGNGGTINSGAPTTIQAVATDTNLDAKNNPVTIQQVQFFQDGTFVGVASAPSPGTTNVYSVTFSANQHLVNGFSAPSALTAIASDTLGFTGTSPIVSVNVTSGGTGSNVVIGTPPTVSLTAPTDQASVIVNTPVNLAATADAPNGNIATVSFLVDKTVIATLTKYPYSFPYTFQNLGTYQLVAQVTDNVGDKTSSSMITVNVVPEPPPTVTINSPTSGGIITAGTGVTVTATASSPSGTIASVQFFENGQSIGTATSAPYTASFTPLSAGVYTLTAIATDNAGEQTTSNSVIVAAVAASQGLGTASYFGTYLGINSKGGTDTGNFGFMLVDGTYGTYIGYSTPVSGPPTIAFMSDLPVSTGGAVTTSGLKGTANATGVSGSLLPSNDVFIGAASQAGSVSVASGYYTGNLGGQAGTQVTGILGADGHLMLYVGSGKFADVGDGSVDSTGAFTITTVLNNQIVGKVNPATGFLSGTLSGSSGGSILAGRVSGGTFSDGVLKNISTRGQVGTGANVMIAGFVVGGTSPKSLLIRAAGPTLSSFGLSGAISATQLQIYSGTAVVASNTGWSSTANNATAVTNANVAVGAFAFPTGSADSALVGTFAPGSYTAMVSGVGSATGIALVEVYDLDGYAPFTSKKLINVSTRGNVGTGSSVMIGGFSINGAAPKRLLIRGAGPALTALNVTGALATPYLQLINTSTQAVIRENFSWQMGNDSALVSAAAQQTGAFAFANGSADSAILMVLPPGTYTAVLSGAQSATGTALIEVYEVP